MTFDRAALELNRALSDWSQSGAAAQLTVAERAHLLSLEVASLLRALSGERSKRPGTKKTRREGEG